MEHQAEYPCRYRPGKKIASMPGRITWCARTRVVACSGNGLFPRPYDDSSRASEIQSIGGSGRSSVRKRRERRRRSSPRKKCLRGTARALTASEAPTAGSSASSSRSERDRPESPARMLPFLIASALGGLFALVMPCVWPMVPITVNFFVKQGQGQGGRARRPGWPSSTACRSSASSRRLGSSSRSFSRRPRCKPWRTIPG